MRLGVITTSYPRFPGDAAGNFVAGHVAALRALGHEVEIIAAGDASAPGASGEADAGSLGDPASRGVGTPTPWPAGRGAAPVGSLGEAGEPLRVGGAGLFYRGGAPDALERAPVLAGAAAAVFTAQLTHAVASRARRWDAIIAHWLAPSAVAALASAPPLLAIAHGGDIFTLRRLHLLGPVLRALRRRDARLVFVSAHLRAIARAAAPALAPWLDQAIIQPMGLDVGRFAALARAPSDPPIVLMVARLVPIKGADVAIAAMQHVRCAARLVIAGDGPERARLAATPGSHTLLGELTCDRRDDLLRTAAVVVVPSRITPTGRTEGTPTIAAEALAAGVPVIASAVGGLCELPGVRLVPPDDPCGLGRAIDQVIADPPPAASLRAGVAMLDWREVAPRLLRE